MSVNTPAPEVIDRTNWPDGNCTLCGRPRKDCPSVAKCYMEQLVKAYKQ